MELASILSEIFQGNNNVHGVYTINSQEGAKLVGKAATVRRPVTEELWQGHINGRQGIGIIPIDEDSKCFFGAIDIDVYPLDPIPLAVEIKKLKLPLIPVKSKSGGLHLYLFMKEKVSAAILVGKLKEFAIKLGYGDVEIFPKQTQILTDRGDIGVWINMPYFNIKEGQSERCGIYPDGSTMSIADFIEEVKTMQQDIKGLTGHVLDLVNEMLDGPPCLQYLIGKKITSGNRNIVLSNLVKYLKKADPENILSRAHEFNNLYFDPPIGDSEVTSTSNSVSKKEYDYTCTKAPLKNYCNRELCLTRKFGIDRLIVDNFKLENLVKYTSDPPIWFVNIAGTGVRLELATEDLQDQKRFQTKCLNAGNLYTPKISQAQWIAMMQQLLQKVTTVEASVDTSPKGQFYEWLEKFCTNRVQAKTKEELLLGKPWTNDGYHYFGLHYLMAYLERNHFKEFKLHQVSNLLKEIKGESGFTKIKGKGFNYWKIIEFVKQTEDFDIEGISKTVGM